VTLRRMLVDLRLVTRTSSGSVYQVNPAKAAHRPLITRGEMVPSSAV
jgi:hypothetical protein